MRTVRRIKGNQSRVSTQPPDLYLGRGFLNARFPYYAEPVPSRTFQGSASQGNVGNLKPDASQRYHLLMPGFIKNFATCFYPTRLHHGGEPHRGIPRELRERGPEPRRIFSLHLRYLHANLMMTEKFFMPRSQIHDVT